MGVMILKAVLSFFLSMLIILGLYIFAISDGDDSDALPTLSTNRKKEDAPTDHSPLNYETPKAMWLSQFDMREIYAEGGVQRDAAEYTRLVGRVISNLSSMGINTVFIQLRPNGDSIYPSEIYPPSQYAVGAYGEDFAYDPFEIFLSLAHSAEISVHAWINPLRCMSTENIENVPDTYTVKRWHLKGQYIKEVDGYLYLDPAYNEVRELVCGGVSEIIESYDIDGVHIDDYFYPTSDESFDMSSYLTLNEEKLSLADFRREQTNKLVRELHDTVKSKKASLLFGVSPSGNTNRNYSELFADVERWCEAGYIDYLCPQIYFGFEHATHPFDAVLAEFSEMTRDTSVSLIVGITLEKADNGYRGVEDKWAGAGRDEWITQKNVIKRSLLCVRELDDNCGVALFSYRLLFDPVTGEARVETREEYENFISVFWEM